MAQKPSTFVQETREREGWLPGTVEREGGDEKEREQLLATAALLRGSIEAIPVPEEFEERSRQRALAHMQQLRVERLNATRVPQSGRRAPWYLRLGHAIQYVFTLGRRR